MTKRRGNGEGTIGKHPKRDLYMTRYWVDLPDGKRKRMTVYGKTREQVAAKHADPLGDRGKGIVLDNEDATVGEFVTRWLEDSAKGDLAPRTYHNYRLQVRRHIVPSLGRMKMKNLTPVHVQALYAAKLRGGLKPASVRYIHAVLHRALEQTVRWSIIPRNPAALVDPPKVRREEIVPLDPSEARAFLDASRGEQFEALFVLSLTTGRRMGEALGLKWSDIDIEAATLRVNRQLQRMRRDSDNDAPGTLAFSEPKNASRRTVDLSLRACMALRTTASASWKKQLRVGAAWRDHGFVFATAVGTPLDAQNIVNRHFKPLLKRSELPDI